MFTEQTNPFKATTSKFFDKSKMPQVDYDRMTAACQQNLDAISKTQKSIFDTVRSVSEMQTNFARQAIEGMGSFMQNLKNAKTVEEKAQLQTDAFKSGVDKMVSHSRDLTDHLSKKQQDLTSQVGETIHNNINHAKDTMKKNTKNNQK